MSMFTAFAKGFLSALDGVITDREKQLLPYGAYLMTIECGMRFLTDYLEGDVYFSTARPEHNLDRARTQLKLAKEMQDSIEEMKKIIFSLMTLVLSLSTMNAQDVLGKWKLEDGTAIVEVYKSGDAFNGKIVWLEKPTQEDGTPTVDKNNPDPALRKRQLIGLNMLHGLKSNGKEYTGGKIYDPGNGKTYNCSMKVEGKVLKVRGSLDKKGLLGRTMDWFRVE